MPNRCNYVFTNNSKTHQKGEICNGFIRKKGQNLCWKHKDQIEVENEIKQTEKEVKNDLEFIQLENSV